MLDIFHDSFLILWMYPVFRTFGHLTAQQTVVKDSRYLQGTIPLPLDLLLYCSPTPSPGHPRCGEPQLCCEMCWVYQRCGMHALWGESPTNERWPLKMHPPFLQGQTDLSSVCSRRLGLEIEPSVTLTPRLPPLLPQPSSPSLLFPWDCTL